MREDWTPYYDWLEDRLYQPGRWAVIPDAPAAPTQINDGLLNEWPFGRSKGAPLWHMDGPIDRFLRLAEKFDRVCIGWIGAFDEIAKKPVPEEEAVGCEAYFRRMDELARAIGNQWPVTHMMRGTLVAREYPFTTADSTSLAQNGHRYDYQDGQHDAFLASGRWSGRNRYADRLERGHFAPGVVGSLRANRAAARRVRDTPAVRCPVERRALQLGLL